MADSNITIPSPIIRDAVAKALAKELNAKTASTDDSEEESVLLPTKLATKRKKSTTTPSKTKLPTNSSNKKPKKKVEPSKEQPKRQRNFNASEDIALCKAWINKVFPTIGDNDDVKNGQSVVVPACNTVRLTSNGANMTLIHSITYSAFQNPK